MVLINSGESLCIRLPTSSVVLKTFFGTEVDADKRLIIVVFCSKQRGGCRFGLSTRPFRCSSGYNPRAAFPPHGDFLGITACFSEFSWFFSAVSARHFGGKLDTR